ncbi:hypothetical protein L21SP2_1091 [Salinispira pacifica]|uniref:Uncharacterized protein n=2 Tax=Salinispira pacifica TaxID=1307761 RepID=V5WH54_9SPIO|nr:hypothetical protein L21SP2_1091 [Salinispira pacifica]
MIPYYLERIDLPDPNNKSKNNYFLNKRLNETPVLCSGDGFFPIEKLKELSEEI